ncbi:hypothetical protein LguiB_023724 [Lonicera macranthoides]
MNRELLETIISNLPQENSSRSPNTTRILFGLLRTANILNASENCRSALEKKIGSQLDQATLNDLLILSYSYLNETLYDLQPNPNQNFSKSTTIDHQNHRDDARNHSNNQFRFIIQGMYLTA